MKKNITKIIFVTGISNLIGFEYVKYYSCDNSHIVIGISRTRLCNYEFKNLQEVQIDLLSQEQIASKMTPIFNTIDWMHIKECILIHTAGKAKNDELGLHTIEDANGDGFDDEMFDAQITTFENLHSFLVSALKKKGVFESIQMKLVGFGSLMDKRYSPLHKSMRAVSNELRKRFLALSLEYFNYRTIILSVTTVATTKELEYRKYADKTYWLSPEELRDQSIRIIKKNRLGYVDEIIFKHHPLFHGYFENETDEQLVLRYKLETGLIKE